MGKSNSKILGEQAELTKNYTIDHRLKQQNITHLTHKQSRQQYLLREVIYNDEAEYQELIKKLEQRKLIKSPYITQLQRLEHYKEENLCSNDYRIYSLWEFPRKTLNEEIIERALLKQSFSEFELRTLILQVSQGLATYQENKKSHECLTTKTILLTSNGIAKVVDVLATPVRPNLDVVFHKRNIKNIYLSPEQCRVIESQQFNDLTEDPFREDIFVVGMIILECALLERQDECYENDYERINWKKLSERLKIVEGKYGVQLSIILNQMLRSNIQERIDWITLIRKLNAGRIIANSKEEVQIPKVRAVQQPGLQLSAPRILVPQKLSASRQVEQSNTNPARNSYIFTYNQNTVQRQVKPAPFIHNASHIHPQQIPLLRIRETAQVIPQPPIITFRNQNQRYLVPPNYIAQPNTLDVSMSSKFTPIALTNAKLNGETLPTPTNQNTFKQTVNNQFKLHSPSSSQPTESNPLEIKNFSLHLNEPVFSIDEYAEGKRYEGYKVNGKKEGEGKFYLDDKLCFFGHWKEDLMQGEGKLYYQSGIIAYDGHFQKDRFHGYGRLYNQSPDTLMDTFNYGNFEEIEEFWTSYEGFFENDLKEGEGELYLTNGQHFSGNFHIDFVQGEGIFSKKDGQKIRGIWHENKLERVLE